MGLKDYNLKGRYGLQNKTSDVLIDELIDILENYFKEKIEDFMVIEKNRSAIHYV